MSEIDSVICELQRLMCEHARIRVIISHRLSYIFRLIESNTRIYFESVHNLSQYIAACEY